MTTTYTNTTDFIICLLQRRACSFKQIVKTFESRGITVSTDEISSALAYLLFQGQQIQHSEFAVKKAHGLYFVA